MSWPEDDKGMSSLSARPTYDQYLKRNLSTFPPQHADDLQWSLSLLQAALDSLDGEDVPLCYTIKGREFSTGRKYSKEVRPDHAGISGTTIHYFEETRTVVWRYLGNCFTYDDDDEERRLTQLEYALLLDELAKRAH
eukprot:s3190_g11.t1